MEDQTKKIAVVIGGSRGIGAAIARSLAARGAVVALLARGSDRLDAEAARIAAAGGRASTHPCDVTDPVALARAIDSVVESHGRLDIVVASAGIGAHGLFRDASLAAMDAIVRINVKGLLHTLHFALPHLRRYPIDTAELVKKAAAYFDEHIFEFPHEDRRIFAQSVFSRSEELGIKVAGDILVYAGDHYGPHIDGELHARISRFDGTGHEAVYELLLEKRADIDPMIMADMLRKADEKTGAAKAYGRLGTGFRDPYAAVYGGPKLAEAQPKEEDTYSWNMGTDYCNGIQLTALSKRGLKLNELFGDGFADAFQKDPIGQFKSMPDPQKVVLSRLAADNSGATNRI